MDWLDNWLIDKVFQPLSDRVSGLCSPYDIARVLSIAYNVLYMWIFGDAAVTNGSLTRFQALMAPIYVVNGTMLFFSIKRAEAHAKSGRRFRNPERYRNLLLRSMCIALYGIITLHAVLLNYFTMADVCAICYGLACYFVACEDNPPLQKQTIWSPAV